MSLKRKRRGRGQSGNPMFGPQFPAYADRRQISTAGTLLPRNNIFNTSRHFMNAAAVLSHSIVQPPLPYEETALAPVISANTLAYHYGKHHKAYVDTVNKLIAGTAFAEMPLEQIVRSSAGQAAHAAIFNSAAQAWNHAFY